MGTNMRGARKRQQHEVFEGTALTLPLSSRCAAVCCCPPSLISHLPYARANYVRTRRAGECYVPVLILVLVPPGNKQQRRVRPLLVPMCTSIGTGIPDPWRAKC